MSTPRFNKNNSDTIKPSQTTPPDDKVIPIPSIISFIDTRKHTAYTNSFSTRSGYQQRSLRRMLTSSSHHISQPGPAFSPEAEQKILTTVNLPPSENKKTDAKSTAEKYKKIIDAIRSKIMHEKEKLDDEGVDEIKIALLCENDTDEQKLLTIMDIAKVYLEKYANRDDKTGKSCFFSCDKTTQKKIRLALEFYSLIASLSAEKITPKTATYFQHWLKPADEINDKMKPQPNLPEKLFTRRTIR